MGIVHLYYFLQDHEEFHDTESLVSLVERHRASTKTRPLVIIDGLSICSKLSEEFSPALFDYALVHQSLFKLSSLLTSLDVDVEVHFPRGNQDHENYLLNMQKSEQRLLYYMMRTYEPRAVSFLFKVSGWSYRDVVKFIFGFYFQVVTSLRGCKKDLHRYARSRNCLAIISQDVILNVQCWHYALLNYSERTVTLFNMQRFANHFNFNIDHMLFVFASLGNWVINAKTMVNSYGKPINIMDRLDRITAALSSYRSLTLNQLREPPNFEPLLDEMFHQADDKTLLYENFARSLTTVHEECDCTDVIEQDNVLMYIKELVEHNKIQPSFYYLLKDRKFSNVYGIQCIRNREFQYGRVMEVYAHLRKKIYYLLFRDVNCTVQEYWAKHNLKNRTVEIETKEINPESPELEINLSLLELMQNEDELIKDLKWKILVNSISSTINVDKFRLLSPKYYYPVLTLHYLLNLAGERVIHNWEADVFLCHLELNNRFPEESRYNARALELINIYNSGLTFICYLVAAAGFPISIETLMESNSREWHFNGRAFYNAYCYLEHRRRDMITDNMSTEPRRLLGLI